MDGLIAVPRSLRSAVSSVGLRIAKSSRRPMVSDPACGVPDTPAPKTLDGCSRWCLDNLTVFVQYTSHICCPLAQHARASGMKAFSNPYEWRVRPVPLFPLDLSSTLTSNFVQVEPPSCSSPSQSLFRSPFQFLMCPKINCAPCSGECCRPNASTKSPSGSIR